MVIFTVLATKGGVGKTTLTVNLAAIFADFGLRVLMVDADASQGSLSKYLPLTYEAPNGLVKVITEGIVTSDCISHTNIPNLHIIRADDRQNYLQTWLRSRLGTGKRLAYALKSPLVSDDYYDVILIDTQGAKGEIQSEAALAGTRIIIPVLPETMAAREFRDGTLDLIKTNEPTPEYRLGPIHALIYRNQRTTDAKYLTQEIRDSLEKSDKSDMDPAQNLGKEIQEDYLKMDGRVSLLQTVVPDSVAYKEAATKMIPVHRHIQKRQTSKTTNHAVTMHELAWELIPLLKGCIVDSESFVTLDKSA